MKEKIICKYGIDIHGIIDKHTFIPPLMEALVTSGHEVHVITGSEDGPRILNYLNSFGVYPSYHYTHFFSISSHLMDEGYPVTFDNNNPFFDDALWNKTKGEYCARNNIDFMLDDSDVYGKFFTTPYAQMKG